VVTKIVVTKPVTKKGLKKRQATKSRAPP
jgi:hypothetical protein